MFCKLYSYPNVSKFPDTWVCLIDGAYKSYIFYYATLLYDNIAKYILYFHTSWSFSENIIPPFYMSTYIIDYLCFSLDDLAMGWKWTPFDPLPIHIYHNIFWESNYLDHFYKNYYLVTIPIYEIVFYVKPPQMTLKAMNSLKKIEN